MSFSYTPIVNPRAKRLSLSVDPVDGLRVVMPRQLSERYIQRCLSKYSKWIERELFKVQITRSQYAKYQFENDGTTIFNGLPHQLEFIKGTRKVIIDDSVIKISGGTPIVLAMKKQYLLWLRREAKKELGAKLKDYSALSGIPYTGFSVRGQKTIWGSCSSKGAISLNWKLMCMPAVVQDYVIMHELTHIRELNHSAEFWKTLKTFIPNMKQHKQWLAVQGDLIQFVTKQFS